jgi:hypothetical protein
VDCGIGIAGEGSGAAWTGKEGRTRSYSGAGTCDEPSGVASNCGLHRRGCIEQGLHRTVSASNRGSLRGGLNGTRNALAVDDPAGDARLGDVRHATSDRRRPAKRRSTGRPFAGRRSVGRRSAGRRSVWPREMDGLERAASLEPPPAPRPRPPSTLLDARLRHRVAAERSLLGAFTCPLRGAHDRRQAFGVGR